MKQVARWDPPKPADDAARASLAAALATLLDRAQHDIRCNLMDQRAERPEQVCTCGLWEAIPVMERLLDELGQVVPGVPGGQAGGK